MKKKENFHNHTTSYNMVMYTLAFFYPHETPPSKVVQFKVVPWDVDVRKDDNGYLLI